jgi:hypothetical protein
MAGAKSRNFCSCLFKRLKILFLPCEYIFSLIEFTVDNQEHFQANSAIPNVSTRNRDHHHRPVVSL